MSGCEKRSRTKNSSGSSGLFEEGQTTSTNVYRFVGAEQSLTDARKAVQEEKWDQAIAATDALLKQQPSNGEAKTINAQARLEMPNLARWNELNKAASGNEVAAAIRHYRAIADTSMYKARAQPIFDKLKDPFVDAQLADERALVRAGRCDDARRIARVTGDWIPDARARLDEAVTNCRQRADAPAIATKSAPPEVAQTEDKAPIASKPSEPIAMAADAPKTVIETKAKAAPAPEPPKTLAAALPAAGIAAKPEEPPATLQPPPAPSAPTVAARNIPIGELEGLRISGEKAPSLPAGAKMIARRDGVKKITMALKLCVSDKGVPTSVAFVKSSDYADANERIMAEVRKWRFRPYMAGGTATPVCTATLLNYQIE